jgi:hypothetical protein
MNGQPAWRFCDKCFGMFYNGNASNKGVCPKDGQAHHAQDQSFLFVLPHRDFPHPSISLRIVGNRRSVVIAGTGFEPNQSVTLEFQFFAAASGDLQTGPATRTSDDTGSFTTDPIQLTITGDISTAQASAFEGRRLPLQTVAGLF